MKLYLSSFCAVFSLLVSLSVPALHAQTPVDTDERPVTDVTPDFSKYETNLALEYPSYFTLNPESVKLQLLEVKEEPDMSYVRMSETPPKDLNSVLVSIETIVNIASKVWKLIQANVPVANIDTKYATAYPQGVTAASQLSQWSKPKSYVYGFYAENLYGSVMIDCKYKVSFAYNGAYKGAGKYLTAVAVTPTVASVGWGYKFYMSASVPDSTITNVGTDKDPIAAMQMKLSWKMATVLKEVNGVSVYYVQGDGFYQEIANPWKVEPKLEDVKAAAPLLTPGEIF
ncbi:MAG: hypothetical protein Q7R35_16650 [Elusimicrobiota bacterium]|nr:hypothetical protein [Elusimicrobiota bacterium]